MADKPSYEELERRVRWLEGQLAAGESVAAQVVGGLHRLYDVFHLLPVYVYLQADDYSIHFANRKFVELFGEPADRRCHQIFRGIDKPCESCRTFEVFNSGRPMVREWTDDQGRSFVIYDTIFPGTIGGETAGDGGGAGDH